MEKLDSQQAFLILAAGSPKYYWAAWSLAMSIKSKGSKTPVILLHDGSAGFKHFGKGHKRVFDRMIQLSCDSEFPFFYKTTLDQHKLPDEVIYIDADSYCLNNPDYLFDNMPDAPFIPIVNKQRPYETANDIHMAWADPHSVYEYYGADKSTPFSEINSSLMYFRPNDQKCKDIFSLARIYYAENHMQSATSLGGHYPDELAFEAAMLKLKYTPPVIKNPIYVSLKESARNPLRLVNVSKPFVTLLGNYNKTSNTVWKDYRNLAKADSRKLALEWFEDKTHFEPIQLMGPRDKAANGLNLPGRYNGLPNPFNDNEADIIKRNEKKERSKPKTRSKRKKEVSKETPDQDEPVSR